MILRHSRAAWRAVGLDQRKRQDGEKQGEDERGSWQQFIHCSCHLFPSTFFSSRKQKHCCYLLLEGVLLLWCHSDPTFVLVKDFPLPIIQTEQTMAFTQSSHDLCLRSCNSVKRRRWGQRSAITATFFGVDVNHLPTVVALPSRSFMLANSIYLCFASANRQRLFPELQT